MPGVYCAGGFDLTGTLTLSGGVADVWIFKSASDLILTGGSAVRVVFAGSGQPCNVWWRVVSTATFDANSTLVGNILADTSITLAAGASLNGRALAKNAEVTLSSNSITGPTCATGAGTGAGIDGVAAGLVSSSSSSSGGSSSAPGAKACPALNYIAPIILESKRIDADSIFISWGPNFGINTFIVSYGLESGKWLYSTNVTGYSTTINGLPQNQPIYVRVATTDNCSVGTYGEPKLVGGPLLPNTGLTPHDNNIPWNIAIPVGIAMLASFSLVIALKKRTI